MRYHSGVLSSSSRNPVMVGGLLAVFAALMFGAATPFIQRLGTGSGPLATAAVLVSAASENDQAKIVALASRVVAMLTRLIR